MTTACCSNLTIMALLIKMSLKWPAVPYVASLLPHDWESHSPLLVHHRGPPLPAVHPSRKELELPFLTSSVSQPIWRGGGMEWVPTELMTGQLSEEARNTSLNSFPDWCADGKGGPWWHTEEGYWVSQPCRVGVEVKPLLVIIIARYNNNLLPVLYYFVAWRSCGAVAV